VEVPAANNAHEASFLRSRASPAIVAASNAFNSQRPRNRCFWNRERAELQQVISPGFALVARSAGTNIAAGTMKPAKKRHREAVTVCSPTMASPWIPAATPTSWALEKPTAAPALRNFSPKRLCSQLSPRLTTGQRPQSAFPHLSRRSPYRRAFQPAAPAGRSQSRCAAASASEPAAKPESLLVLLVARVPHARPATCSPDSPRDSC
jgi:hypothetical protein